MSSTIRNLIIVALVIAGLLVLLGPTAYPSQRKRITLQVATPNGIVSGSSVIEIGSSRAPWWFPSPNRVATSLRGEAPYVDLGGGRFVFVALNTPTRERPINHCLTDQYLKEDGSFDSACMPLLITFGNIQDANSVREVDPADFSTEFGPGFRLHSLTAADTRDKPAKGTLERFAPLRQQFLSQSASERLRGLDVPRGDVRTIGWYAFVAGAQ